MKKTRVFMMVMMVAALAAVPLFSGGGQDSSGASQGASQGGILDLSKRGAIKVVSRGVTAAVGKNATVDMLAQKFNMDIDWDVRPSSGYIEATMVIISSGDYPDVMEGYFSGSNSDIATEFEALYEDGIILPLNGLLRQYGSNIEAARSHKETWFWMKDGERVSIPCRWVDIPESWLTIRQDWLDALGLKMPATLDELAEVARAFTFKDPDKNGKNDTIGLAGTPNGDGFGSTAAFRVALGAYGETTDWEKAGNQWEPYEIRQGTREAVKWLRDRYQEGVFEKDFMTMTRDQYLERKNLNQYGIEWWWSTHMGSGSAWWGAFNKNVPQQRTSVLFPVAAKGYKAVNSAKPGLQGGAFQLLVFAKTKEAARIIAMIDYLATDEGADWAMFGPQGKSWDLVNGVIKLKDLTEEQRLNYGVGALNTFFWKNVLKRDTEPFVLEAIKTFPLQFAHVQDFPAYSGDRSALGSLAKEAITNMIVQPNVNVDSAFAAFRSDYLRMGGQAYIDYMTKQFNAALK
jgi:putative aldouronate transport system substrate-binding protein